MPIPKHRGGLIDQSASEQRVSVAKLHNVQLALGILVVNSSMTTSSSALPGAISLIIVRPQATGNLLQCQRVYPPRKELRPSQLAKRIS